MIFNSEYTSKNGAIQRARQNLKNGVLSEGWSSYHADFPRRDAEGAERLKV